MRWASGAGRERKDGLATTYPPADNGTCVERMRNSQVRLDQYNDYLHRCQGFISDFRKQEQINYLVSHFSIVIVSGDKTLGQLPV